MHFLVLLRVFDFLLFSQNAVDSLIGGIIDTSA